MQVSSAPVYVIATSTPKVDVNKTQNVRSLFQDSKKITINSHATEALLRNLLSPINKDGTDKNALSNSDSMGRRIKGQMVGPLTATKSCTYQFTGNEKPFVPRARVVPAPSTDCTGNEQKKSLLKQNQIGQSEEDGEKINGLKKQPSTDGTPGGTDLAIPTAKLLFLTISKDVTGHANNANTLPVLLPVSPVRQVRMELEAGMKPSLPVSSMTFQKGGARQSTSFGNTLQCEQDKRFFRPILGRKFCDAPAVDLSTSESYKQFCAGIQPSIPPAHSSYKLSSLAAEDSAIILAQKAQVENVQPLDLSIKTRNDYAKVAEKAQVENIQPFDFSIKTLSDYAKVWNQMTTKTNNGSGSCGLKTGSREFDVSVIGDQFKRGSRTMRSICSGEEKPSFPKDMIQNGKSDLQCTGKDVLANSNAQNFEDLQKEPLILNENQEDPERRENTTVKEILQENNVASSRNVLNILKAEKVGVYETSNKIPLENETQRRCNKKSAEYTSEEKTTVDQLKSESDDKLVIAANNSSTSTIPYGEDFTEPLNLSCSKDSLQARPSPADVDVDTFPASSDLTSHTFLGVTGNAIKAKSEDAVIPKSYPLETSEGLMDSVFEEDMVKGDSHLASPYSPTGTELSSSFRLYGNNIWKGPNHDDDNPATWTDSDSYVSDSEEGYLTCNTSLSYDAKLQSPVIDVLSNRNDSGRGYSVYSKRNTPIKVIKWLKHSSDDLHKDVITDIANGLTDERYNEDEKKIEETKYKRIVLKGIQHMLMASDKLENILTFDSHGEPLPEIKTTQLTSVVKAYINATTRCINKIAQILKNGSKGKGQTLKKDSNRLTNKKGKRAPPKTKLVKTGQLRNKAESAPENKAETGISFQQNPEFVKTDENEKCNKATELSSTDQTKHQGIPLIGAMDLVTSMPIDGNRYWKKRMLRQNLSEDSTPSSLKKAIKKNIDKTIPECRKGLLLASFSDDDECNTEFEPKLTWTPCCKTPTGLIGSDKKNHSKGEKSYSYKKLKNVGDKGTQGKGKNGGTDGKRKRSKGSPTGVSPTNNHTPKKTKNESPDAVVGHITSSNRRHFPYQNVSYNLWLQMTIQTAAS